MKKQAIITSILALATLPAYAAIDCATPPTCESLGYTTSKTQCNGNFCHVRWIRVRGFVPAFYLVEV